MNNIYDNQHTKYLPEHFTLDQVTTDFLDYLELRVQDAWECHKEGNEWGHDVIWDEVNAGIHRLGVDRRILIDLGWDLYD